PSYGGFGTWSGGSATATVIGYKAETGDTLTVTDGSQGAAGTSNAFDIRPAQLASFAWTLEPASSQVAGTPFTATAKAYDAYGNVKTDYQGGTANVSGLHAAPTGPQVAVYPSWSNGVLTGQFIDYRTEPGGTSLKVTDGIVTATSSSFVVNPGPLGSFAWTTQPPAAVIAGAPFGAQVTAYDLYGNVKTDYPGSATASLSGFDPSPSPPAIFGGKPAGGVAPSYGTLTWGSGTGVGTVTGVTDFDAEQAQLRITDAAAQVSRQSSQISVSPASPYALRFTQQPTEAQVNAKINALLPTPGVAVQVVDSYGNLASNTSVHLVIGANPGSGSLNGTTTQPTNATGTATFADLTINKVGIGYTVVATAPPTGSTTQTSVGFTIAQTVDACTGSTCTGSASITNQSTINANASGTNPGSTLGVALAATAIPSGVCSSFQEAQGLTPSAVNVNYVSGSAPSLVLTWTISKSVRFAVTNNGLAHYNVCLGGVRLDDQSRGIGPKPVDPTPGFPIKTSAYCPTTQKTTATACPVWNATFQSWIYWGIIPDCPAAPAVPTGPCMASRATGTGGVVILTIDVPSPWDPLVHGGS
ncbi:MAG TPA: hypothetical protein VFA05_00815, partial [Gaiellaceae bacterium]|nr:hypothetical protein [Gaiellaceae bacterium]